MKKIMNVFSVLLTLTAISLSVSPKTLQLESKFNAEEIKWVKEAGSASVQGKAFITLKNKILKGCGGFNMELLPASTYANERILKTYGNNVQGKILIEDNPPKFTPDVKEYHELVIKSTCNKNNEFVFNNVSAGDYYVMAFIIWDETKDGNPVKAGGAAMRRIKVAPDSKNKITLKM